MNNIINVPLYGIVSQDTYGASSNIIDGGNQIKASIALIDLGISGFGQYKWDRFEFVFTPKHGSWLNMAKIQKQQKYENEYVIFNPGCTDKIILTLPDN